MPIDAAASPDATRYRRQIVLPEWGVAGQEALAASGALVVGLGGLGSVAAALLAGAGIGRLWLADHDAVDLTNLHRQTLYRQGDIGEAKALAARRQLAALNPGVGLDVLPGGTADPAFGAALAAADLVLDCTDNFTTRAWLNRAAVAAGKPLVSGAAIRWEGQVALFAPRRGCYACVYGDVAAADDGDTERCEDAGVAGPVPTVIGAQQALLALQWLTGAGRPAGRLHLWNALAMGWRTLGVTQDPQCPVCGVGQNL